MIQTHSKDYPQVTRSDGKILVPYQIEDYKDSEGNNGYQFYYCPCVDFGQDISNEDVILELISLANDHNGSIPETEVNVNIYAPYEKITHEGVETVIYYVVTSPSNFKATHGHIGNLTLIQDTKGAVLDNIWSDCYKIYPRPGQSYDAEKVVIKMRVGAKMQAYLADQCESDNPFYDPDAVAILDVYNQFFGSLEKLKEEWPDLAGTFDVEYTDEEGITQIKTITVMDEDHHWAGD